MGCGSSQPAAEPDKKSKSLKSASTSEIEDLIGKKIPKLLIQAEMKHRFTADEEAIKSDLISLQPPQENDNVVARAQKKMQKKYRGGEDVEGQIIENVKRVEREMQQSDVDLIIKSFKSHFVFFSLPQDSLQKLIENMFYCTIKAGEFVFKQGNQASAYFVIERGQVEIIINENPIRVLKQGDQFGEIALLYNATRSASTKALTNCGFWSLERATFKKTIEEITLKEYDENRKFIDQVQFFSFMTSEQRDMIGNALITTKFNPGQNIVNEGDQADSFYVIKSGQVQILKGDKLIRKMGAKDSFGEQALYEKSVRGATVKAETEVRCVALGRENLTKILGDKIQLIIFNNIMRWSFEKSEILKQLTKIQLEKISQKAKIENFKKGQVIFEAKKPCDKLVVVLEGVLINSKQESVTKGSCFGDQFLQKERYGSPLECAFTMVGDGVLATITFQALFKIFGGDLETALKKNENSHEKKIQQIGKREDASHIVLEDLIYIKKLGEGQFGIVYLVKHKETKKVFALKSVSKASIIEQNLEKHITQEKTVLEQINFPFIMGFVRTFKDDMSIYFLVDFIRGMELFDVIRDIGLLQKPETQFYIGTMILCIEYLHSKSIVYRDLKPENIMVNAQGFMYLIDLGTAKPLLKTKACRTYTIIGTPHYMAPEIIAGKGYTFSVDLWSIGICMYEFMCGGVPFGEELEDPYQIYEEIMNTQIKYPTFLKDRHAKKFMEQLMNRQPETRLGASYSALKAHQWFDDFDFDKLFSRELKPPYLPKPENMVSEQDIQKRFNQNKLVLQEIKNEQDSHKIKYNKHLAKDPNWDKDF
uniref:cGMP-dependent protein kinase n=1 Tax=Paramecium tetraurelia TaxID=5888 RepID=Q869J9_PARTE|nr:cGMP-dependent protein kinase [Paramecium tetraurelia]